MTGTPVARSAATSAAVGGSAKVSKSSADSTPTHESKSCTAAAPARICASR